MITAIPIKDEHISSHFSRADSVVVINSQGEEISRFANPALMEGCEGKKQLVSLILSHGATRVIVRNIGQQLLSKLLSHKLSVFHANKARMPIKAFAEDKLITCEQYTEVIHGRPSSKHIAKQAKNASCGHHEEGGCHSGRCDSHQHNAEFTAPKHCCHKNIHF